MSSPVARTCTELDAVNSKDTRIKAHPLSAFRDTPAFVLLGDPGSGKTTEFKAESEALGDSAVFLSARDFISLDVDSHPEWREKTLFIDGLDEMRVGTSDSRTPLDQIRNRLDRLGRPKFRLSCRETDWLGSNDRQSLSTVSPDSKITVLRLNPLDDHAITELLSSLDLHYDVSDFIDEAQRRGVGAVLQSPLTLKLLVDAIGQGETWPDSRQETFYLACRNMALEQNDEHIEGINSLPTKDAMDAAGYLYAVQLLAGTEGYSLISNLEDPSFPAVGELLEVPGQPPRNNLRQVLATRLFSGTGERRFRPVHRHIAEFLAGRYLAELISEGLPTQRVLALMTSPSDKIVVTVLRGLSAWLAVHSPEARRRLIDVDPVGVGLYGDIGDFSTDNKKRLLESLTAFAEQGPLFGHERSAGSRRQHMASTAWAFRSLASADMTTPIKDILTGSVDGVSNHRVMEFALTVLSEANESELGSLGVLVPDLEAILVNPARQHLIRGLALKAFLRIVPSGSAKARTLLPLLEKVNKGKLPDPDGDFRVGLLINLHPAELSPAQVWKYAIPLNPYDLNYHFFWLSVKGLLEKSSGQQLAELLDAMSEDVPNLASMPNTSMPDKLSLRLLTKGLDEFGEGIEPLRLYNWLGLIGDSFYLHQWKGSHLRGIHAWLETRPHIQKAIFLVWLRQRNQDGSTASNTWAHCDALLRSRPPSDLGLWCLDKAIELVGTELLVAQNLLEESHRSLQNPAINKGLSLDAMRSRIRTHDALAQQLEELCVPPSHMGELEKRQRAHIAELQEKERQRQADWEARLRSRELELRENRLSPPDLHTMAYLYFGAHESTHQDAPTDQHISKLIGGDPELVDAVMVALRNAIWRDDIPEARETISIRLKSSHPWLAFPVLASLDLLYKDDPTLLDELDDTLKRKALAIHYCVFPYLNFSPDRSAPWFDHWLEQDPELVGDVLFQCAHAAIRAGEQILPGLRELDLIEDTHADLTHELSTKLLKSFPVRARKAQLPLLERLLDKLLKTGKPELDALIEEKLSMKSMDIAQQIRWLTVGALLPQEYHLSALEECASQNQKRIQHLAESLINCFSSNGFASSPQAANLSPEAIATFIRLLGDTYTPKELSGAEASFVTTELDISWQISDLISLLGSMANDKARHSLTELISNPQLDQWKAQLTKAQESQRVLLRDATFKHPSVEKAQSTLAKGLPANVADLSALVNARLSEIAEDIRGDNSNIWSQFWNEGKEPSPRYEERCRDALLAILKERLPREIVAAPEGRYVSYTRADICVSYGGFNVPIEIKKNCHRKLWSSLRNQLIQQYTTDPETSGHGIYLVLWFGADRTKPSPDGYRPTTPEKLKNLLEKDLTQDEARKISVQVIDVTKP